MRQAELADAPHHDLDVRRGGAAVDCDHRLFLQNGAATGPVRDVDRLHPAPVLERGAAVLAAEAGGLDAAEGRLDRGEVVGVDPGGAGVEPGDHPVGAGEVAGEDAGGEAVGGGVGAGDRLVLAVEGEDRHHRAEDLLPRDRHGVGDAGEDGRLRRRSRPRSPAARARSPPVSEPGAFGAAVGDDSP